MSNESPETILIFAANPINQDSLNLSHEVREIQNALRHSRKPFEIKQQWATRVQDLRTALLDYKPDYVHFCGHGTGRAGLVLNTGLVKADALAELFKIFAPKIKCVVFNACYSLIQAQAVAKHVDFVIGMNEAIGDPSAIKFARGFYDALGDGQPIEVAYKLGRNAIHLENMPEHLTPVLLKQWGKSSTQHLTSPAKDSEVLHRDWDGAPAVSLLYGREAVAEVLKSWILDEGCRIVLITGLGGVGKTDLATCLGRGGNQNDGTNAALSSGLQGQFDLVMWRSLLNAPPPEDLFEDMLDFLSSHQRGGSHSPEKQLEDILQYLQNQRCLIILDNIEAILRPDDPSMRYRDGYEYYGTLFEMVGKIAHQSCLLLTSREKPHAVAELEGVRKPVRSLALTGIGAVDSRNLFSQIGTFAGSNAQWNQIAQIYNGNPLALELAARHIDQVFGGDLSAFLNMGRPIFADLEELLDWHLDRLTDDETELVYWMAIEREPVSQTKLYDNLFSYVSRVKLTSVLQSLQRRIPLERSADGYFSLQPVLIEHVTSKIIERVVSAVSKASIEFTEGSGGSKQYPNKDWLEVLNILNTHALVKATAKDNVRDSQYRLIMDPVIEQLLDIYGERASALLIEILKIWQREKATIRGYLAGNIINVLSRMNVPFNELNFSNLRIRQACLHNVNLHDTDFSFADFRQVTFRQAFGTVFSISYSPDGRLIAVGDDNGEVLLYYSENGDLHMRCTGHSDVVSFITFSPDGQLIASSSFDNTIRLWNAADGRCVNIFLGHEGWIYSLAFSPDGETIASASEDGTCRIWNIRTGNYASPVMNEPGFLSSVAFSPDGHLLAVAGSSGIVNLFSVSDLERPMLLRGHTGRIRSLAFSRQGDMLASGAEDKNIILWKPSDGSLLETLSGHSGDVMSLSFSDAGDILASASPDHTVRLWSTTRMQCVGNLQVAPARVWTVSCNPVGRTLATGSEDGAVRVWNMDAGECLITLCGYSNKTWSLAFTADPSILVAANEDALVRVWDIRDAQTRFEMRGHASRIWAIDVSPDGRWVISASDDLTVRLWDLSSGISCHVMTGHTDWIRAVAFNSESRLAASGGEDGKVFIWDANSGRSIVTIQCKIPRIFTVEFCRNGEWLAVGGTASTIQLYSVSSGKLVGELDGHDAWLTDLISVNGNTLASCSEDGTIKLWDLTQAECSNIFVAGSDVWCGDYSKHWASFLSGSEDGILRRWNMKSNVCEAQVKAHQGSIWSLAIDIAEEIVATTGDDGAIRLWTLPDLAPCTSSPNILRAARPYEGMNISGSTGITQAQQKTLDALGAIAMPSK